MRHDYTKLCTCNQCGPLTDERIERIAVSDAQSAYAASKFQSWASLPQPAQDDELASAFEKFAGDSSNWDFGKS